MSDTWSGSSSTDWFTNNNWKSGHNGNTHQYPTSSSTGTTSVVINGSAARQPVISPDNAGSNTIWVAQTLNTGGAGYTVLEETQIDGMYITLTNNADLTIQGIAMGVFYDNSGLTAAGHTMTGLHGALSSTPSYDSHMQLISSGNNTLTVDTVNENFGLIAIGTGSTLTIDNITSGGNAQQLHGLINYGEISVASGGLLIITAESGTGSTVANFYNAGWIVDNGGTISISSSILDGANNAGSATTANGYIEIGGGGDVILANTVASTEQVTFTDNAANTLQITAGTLFSGTVNNFGSGNTIIVNGFSGTSNATLTTVGGVTELITTNGTVQTTITLTGSVSSNFSVGTNASGQEVIMAGGNTISGNTTYASGTNTLSGSGGTVTNSGTIAVTGSGTDLVVTSSLAGTGSFFIDYGGTLELDNPSGTDAGQTIIFGTHGAASALNTLIINDNTAGFGGHITGFGSNDDIILGASVLPSPASGQGIALSYAGGVLTVSETNAAGAVLSSTALSLAGTAALSTASFVALESAKGVNIETAPTTSTSYSFSGTGSFEDYTKYAGAIAPGDIISANMTVAIAAGTASVTSGGVTDNGRISVASGAAFIDSHSLAGTGSLTIAAGGNATLTGTTSLASISDAGTLTLAGTDAAAISLAAGAQAILSGNFTDSAAITGAGTLTVKTGVTGSLASGSSIASVLDSGTLNLAGSFGGAINMQGNSASSTVDFLGANSTNHTLNASITNFGTSDKLIIGSANFSLSGAHDVITETYSNGVLTLSDATSGASLAINLGLAAGDSASNLSISTSGGVLSLTLCFYPGTALATPGGTAKVEDIRPGDVVTTLNGPKTVRWVGQNHIHAQFCEPLRAMPIRIRAGALGDGLPVRDLLLSPDHAICIDEVLIQASALVNGTSIFREHDVPDQFTYYHIELDSHELLLAEGVAAESFVDNADRSHFHNWDARTAPRTPITEMEFPRAKAARQIPQSIARRLGASRAA